MDNFFELVHFLNRYKVRQIEVLSNPENGKNPSRYRLLYDAIWEGKAKNMEEAAGLFGLDSGSKVFKRLVAGLKKRLYNSVLFIDLNQPEFNEPQRAFAKCHQLQAVMQTLMWRGAPQSAAEIAQEILQVARKYQFSEFMIAAAELLKRWFSIYQPDAGKFAFYTRLLEEQTEVRRLEVQALHHYQSIQLLNTASKSGEYEIADRAAVYCRTLAPHETKVKTVFFQQPFRLLEIAALMGQRQWTKAAEACRNAIHFFNQSSSAGRQVVLMFYQQLAVSLMMQGHYDQAREAVRSSLNLALPGTHHWFKILELQLAIELHAGCYRQALERFAAATGHEQFGQIPPAAMLPWQLYRAYLQLLSASSNLHLNAAEQKMFENFSINRLTVECSGVYRDKQGRNIPLLIVQTLALLFERRLDEAECRIEALRKYRQRRLAGAPDRRRTILFIQLLETLTASGFGFKPLPAKTRETILQFSKIPMAMHEIEIIPYPALWAIVEKFFFTSGPGTRPARSGQTALLRAKP